MNKVIYRHRDTKEFIGMAEIPFPNHIFIPRCGETVVFQPNYDIQFRVTEITNIVNLDGSVEINVYLNLTFVD
ncbi:MAG TPA: hypothetical protein VJ583_03490 [Nitrososphaeraceae archaeon]|nr:hypothetical protein [Nitrososphaeraceae archaeon]